jgi:integrase
MPKGSVNIEVFKDRLRLAWSWAAEIKARQIELDMASGNFDPSLVKYKPQKQESISVSELFDQFVEYKRRSISIGGLNKYLALQKHVSVFFKNKKSISVSEG